MRINAGGQAGFAVWDAVQGANHRNSRAIARVGNAKIRQRQRREEWISAP